MKESRSDPGRPTATAISRTLRSRANPDHVANLQRFFKTGPGQYGEGDRFIGAKLPGIRAVCRECRGTPLDEILKLLRSPIHEERTLALLMLVDAFKAGDEEAKRRIYDLYLAHTAFVNNWDLVDCSAGQIAGRWLRGRSTTPLTRLARSKSLWERRIAMIATFDGIRRGEFDDALRIADLLLDDEHDLIHKAVGWMLREVGQRDGARERAFLKARYKTMPRTMLRYAIEKFPERERRTYLEGKI
jgi:3-methyladenine DNA glycosylase AlkD